MPALRRTANTHRLLISALALCSVLLLSSVASAKYNPEHPEVQAMVKKGIEFISANKHNEDGGVVLQGLAVLKGLKNKNHPKIGEAVAAVRRMVKPPKVEVHAEGPVYAIGISIIFLCELDAEQYRPEIQTMLDWLLKEQKPHGGFGYPSKSTGDTSMTQYGVLCMWTASHHSFVVPEENVARVCNWLIRTQDISGGFGYQGVDPGSYTRVNQRDVSPSLSAAGAGSLYICGDLLGLKEPKVEAPSDLPPGMQRVETKEEKVKKATNMVDLGRYNQALGGVNGWFAKNGGINDNIAWVYYYMYALERYMSFYEYSKFGKHQENSEWYDTGVEFLKKSRAPDGSWSSQSGPVAGTCFAVLFLVRSTRTTLEKAQKPVGGELAGGKGLAGALETARVNSQGKVVTEEDESANTRATVGDLVDRFGSKEYDASIALPSKIELPDDRSEREKQLEKLRQLVSAERYEAREIAVRTLIENRSLDNVPVLVYALTDPDNRIVILARNELRYISRRFTGFGLPDEPTDAQKLTAARRWRDWYYALRPEAEEREEIVLP